MKIKTILIAMLSIVGVAITVSWGGNKSCNHENNHAKHHHTMSQEQNAQLKSVLAHYYHLKDALVKSNAADAAAAAKAMSAALDSVGITVAEHETHIKDLVSEMGENLQHIAETDELEHQREHFAAVSDKLYEWLKIAGVHGDTVYRQYCPMAFDNNGAHWLSSEKEIRNPYFGNKMLKCGSIKETL